MHPLKPTPLRHLSPHSWIVYGLTLLFLLALSGSFAEEGFGPPISIPHPKPSTNVTFVRNLIDQPMSGKESKSRGCVFCHKGIEEMHSSPNVVLGCTDCHGGNANLGLTMARAHVQPRDAIFWKTSANPVDSSVLLNHESAEFIQFVNPADLRVADKVCGTCHNDIIGRVHHSMMNHGAMLWGAALYNNGAVPHKDYRFGQAYGADGAPLRLLSPGPVSAEETRLHGELPFIEPLPRFPISQPGNILRIFERGGEKQTQLGIPNPFESPGKPARRLGERGLGTLNRIDPVVLNLQKTRLHDPLLGFMGSNDHPGDYRSSGCSACHVVYANDRSPSNAGWYSKFGNQGLSFSGDQSGLRKNERGHPIKHQFTRSIPSSQCITCHMHQGNLFVNPYLGYTWWDQESDGEFMYPKKQKNPTDAELAASLRKNPEAAAAKGLWGDLDFLEKVAELNPKLKQTQFADYHGHGWIFRAVFKKDRKGNLLTLDDEIIPADSTNKFARAVHLKDVHLARGMQCVDCHFDLDVHGNGKLYGEPRAATAIECIDCHGTISKRPSLVTSGNAKTMAGDPIDLAKTSTPWGPRFEWEGRKLFQHSMMSPDTRWEIPQTVDTIDPSSSHYNAKSAYAKTIQRDGRKWGGVCQREEDLAHNNGSVSCQICHTSWATSCFGCHLPMRANQKVAANKYEGITTRNYTSYNPQVVRDDVFMLGIDGTVKSNRLAVLRSSSAVIVGSQNSNREWVYSQQQTVSAEGYSGQAFNPHFPHTTSSVGTTRGCSDCHVAKENNNNAIMAQLLGFGTGTVNFFGRYAYVGEGRGGLDGVVWTEQDEPQAAVGSHLHQLAYPDNFAKHEAAGRKLDTAYHHEGKEILDLTLRGEYLYTANGEDGFEVFDVANIDQKGFSEHIVSSPVSPLGQRTYVPTKYATSVALPSTLGIDPARTRLPQNEEQKIHMLYAYVYITDREEGLVMVNVATLVDGDPANNFLPKKIVFNPDDKLHGATHCYVAGHRLFLTAERGLFILDIDDPEHPRIISEVTSNFLNKPRAVGIQFRYAFVTDADGLKVIDITDPVHPRPVTDGILPLKNAQRFYLARTYAYVANGSEGLAIVDIENPEKPGLVQMFNSEGALNDTRAVQVGSVNASEYALVADGKNGLRVIQLISPDTVAEHMGFSPKPSPRIIATYPTKSPAVAVSRGLDRDRVVDESGNQTVVFGRRGARPFNETEMKKFYQHGNPTKNESAGKLYAVEDVVSRNGRLTTQSGEVLEPTVPFVAEPAEQPVRPSLDRLVRRPD